VKRKIKMKSINGSRACLCRRALLNASAIYEKQNILRASISLSICVEENFLAKNFGR